MEIGAKDQAKEKLRLAQLAYHAVDDDDHPKVLLTKKTTNSLRSDALFVDSGASRHLSSDRSSFAWGIASKIPTKTGASAFQSVPFSIRPRAPPFI
jgi:hypothetical protein